MIRRTTAPTDLTAVVSALAGYRVRIGEIIDALDMGRSTYYEQRDDGRLLSADNLLRLAAAMDLNPAELLVRCGLLSADAVVDCAERVSGAEKSTSRRRRLTDTVRPRKDLPPL